MNSLAPQIPGRITASSAGTNWSGFPLEVHRLPARGVSPSYVYPRSIAFLYLSGETNAVIRHGGKVARCVRRSTGMLNLRQCGWAVGEFEWDGPGEIELLAVQLCPRVVEGLGVGNLADTLESLSADGCRDEQLAALMVAMRVEVERGCPSGPLYSDSLSLALAVYTAGRYAPRAAAAVATRARVLSTAQVRRIREFVKNNLGENLRLPDLAALVGLTAHHFSVLFRNTLGVSPHQYLIGERVRAAQAMLREGRQSITTIALQVGFSSHSHFCDTFRRHTGETPGRVRQRQGLARTGTN